MGSVSNLQLIRHAAMVPVVKLGLAPYQYVSDWSTPFGWNEGTMYGLTAQLSGLPWAEKGVHILVRVLAPIGTSTRYVTLRFGTSTRDIFKTGGGVCIEPAKEALVVIAADDWNAQLQSDGAGSYEIDIRLDPSASVPATACLPTYGHAGMIRFQLDYTDETIAGAPESIGWRTYAPVLRDDGTIGHLDGEWKFDPVTGCLVVQIESQGKVSYGGLNASPKVAVAGRPGDGCVESYTPYEIRGSVVRFSGWGECAPY